jgi:dihydrofolate reductase
MAQLIVSTLTSLDGYCAGSGGALDGLPMDDAFDAHNLDLMRRAGTLLFGPTSFAMFRAFWPKVDPLASDFSPAVREIARLMPLVGKLVVSDTLQLDTAGPWEETEVVRRAQALARIRELKAGASRDLVIYGSPVLASDLLAQGLVDELCLLVGHVVLGAGVRTLQQGLSAQLRLLDASRLEGSDTVRLRYACGAA